MKGEAGALGALASADEVALSATACKMKGGSNKSYGWIFECRRWRCREKTEGARMTMAASSGGGGGRGGQGGSPQQAIWPQGQELIWA